MPEAARTLVKSPPELWAEVSDPASLTRHLGAFGDIRITRTTPESTVAWEGDRASGTVDLEPAGWGTKVTVRAEEAPDVPPEAAGAAEPPAAEAPTVEVAAVADAPRPGWFARLFRRRPKAPEPVAAEAPAPPEPPAGRPEPVDAAAVLDGMLASLGSAHHRPFSRG
jgi:hypothetical protein